VPDKPSPSGKASGQRPDELSHLGNVHPPARPPRQSMRQLQEGHPLSLEDALGNGYLTLAELTSVVNGNAMHV
jgi:hypothetical protein